MTTLSVPVTRKTAVIVGPQGNPGIPGPPGAQGPAGAAGTTVVHDVTGNYTVTETSGVVLVAISGLTANMTLTLPTSPTAGMDVKFVDSDGSLMNYTVTISGAQTVNGQAAGVTLAGGQSSGTVSFNGANWIMTARSVPRLPPIDSHTMIRWSLDEASSPFANTGNAGALNLTSTSAVPSGGLFSGALNCEGQYGGISADTSIGEVASNITIDFWVYLTRYTATPPEFIDKKYQTSSTWSNPYTSVTVSLNTSNDGSWLGGVTIGGTRYFASAQLTSNHLLIPLGVWTKVTMQFDGSFIYLLINGNLACPPEPASGSIDWGGNGAWQFGYTIGNANSGVPGLIDEGRIENVVRSKQYLQTAYRMALGICD